MLGKHLSAGQVRQIVTSRVFILGSLILGLALVAASASFNAAPRLIWNRSESAPMGLYWRYNHPPQRGDWVIVSPDATLAQWASSHGLTGSGWPLIKRVAALEGDQICRKDRHILINGVQAGRALEHTNRGQKLPEWSGCQVLNGAEIFLINDHPASLDGRYFGPNQLADLDGIARLVWRFGP